MVGPIWVLVKDSASVFLAYGGNKNSQRKNNGPTGKNIFGIVCLCNQANVPGSLVF